MRKGDLDLDLRPLVPHYLTRHHGVKPPRTTLDPGIAVTAFSAPERDTDDQTADDAERNLPCQRRDYRDLESHRLDASAGDRSHHQGQPESERRDVESLIRS